MNIDLTHAEIARLLWWLVGLLVAYSVVKAALRKPDGMRG